MRRSRTNIRGVENMATTAEAAQMAEAEEMAVGGVAIMEAEAAKNAVGAAVGKRKEA